MTDELNSEGISRRFALKRLGAVASGAWRPALRDPSDELLLEVAMAAACRNIVTHNVRDFAGSERFAVHICTPREWLTKIGERP